MASGPRRNEERLLRSFINSTDFLLFFRVSNKVSNGGFDSCSEQFTIPCISADIYIYDEDAIFPHSRQLYFLTFHVI